jgi:epoxyqueuosine reductase QueG
MSGDKQLTENILKYSKKIGIDIIGFADPKLYNKFKNKNRPDKFLEGAQTVIIVGIYLYDIILDAWSQDQNTGKSFHYLDSVIENRLRLIKEYLAEKGYESKIIPYNPGLFLKDSAALAGIGPIGKNNLLITENFGSQVRLRGLVTNAPLLTGTPIEESKYCIKCNKCVDSCPVDALSQGTYNRDSCLTYNLANLRKLSKYTAIWCNVCIESCPVGKKSTSSNLEGYFAD